MRSLRFTKMFEMLPIFALEKSIEYFILEMDGEQLEQVFILHVHLHYIGSVKFIRISREHLKHNYDQHKNNHSIRIWRIYFYIDKTIFNVKLDVLDLNWIERLFQKFQGSLKIKITTANSKFPRSWRWIHINLRRWNALSIDENSWLKLGHNWSLLHPSSSSGVGVYI